MRIPLVCCFSQISLFPLCARSFSLFLLLRCFSLCSLISSSASLSSRAFLYESSLVSWFPLRMAKEALSREVAQLGNIGVPPPPSFKLEECRSEYNRSPLTAHTHAHTRDTANSSSHAGELLISLCILLLRPFAFSIEVCWEVGAVTTANNNNALVGATTGGVKSAAAAEESKAILRLTSIAPAPAGAPTSAQNIPPSFFILHMSAIDPFDLSQDHLLFGEIYRGPLTAFIVNGLSPGRSYLFRVQAVSIMGEGVWSQKICMSTLNQPAPQAIAPPAAVQDRAPSLYGGNTPSYGVGSQHHRPTGSGGHGSAGGPFGAPLPSASHSGFHTSTNSGAASPVHRAGANGYAKGVPASASHQHQHQQSHDHQAMGMGIGRTPLQSMPSSALPSALPSPRRSAALAAASASGSSPSLQLQQKPSHAPSPRVGWDELHKLSMILREKDVPALMRFFAAPLPVDSAPITPRSFQLLYRGSRDGMSTRAWHLAVDGMGPTLSVIRVKKDNRDYVFGGFASERWLSPAAEAVYKSSGSTWLFSLINAYKRNLKFKIKKGQEKYAQCNDREHAAMVSKRGPAAHSSSA